MSATTLAAPPILLTTEQVSAEYGIPTRSLINWRLKGQGPPYIKVASRAVRYRRDALEAWLSSRTVTPQPACA